MRCFAGWILLFLPAIIFLSAWESYVIGDQRREFLFASPSLILNVAVSEMSEYKIWNDIVVTFCEALFGLVLGCLLGTFFGLLFWTNETLAKIARPYIVITGAIPIFAIAPMLIIWFGTGLFSKVVMSAFAVFFVSLAQAYDGAKYCEKEHSHYAKSIGASRGKVIQKIVFPGALRWVTAGLKISIGLALVGAFIGEFVSSQAGLGHYILSAGSLYDMPRVMFGVILISLLALSLTGVVWSLERWKPNLFSR